MSQIALFPLVAAMYLVSKKLKIKHNITVERAALYKAANTWCFFAGGATPS
ncbi:hypothetical protein MKX03_020001 [Papaver bracteatum]|nr:hypothetical protein MKX03_020001 [Papaver bracteatum]